MGRGLWLFFIGLVALSVGCATGPKLREPYQNQKAEPPLWISWNHVRRDPGTLVAEGIIRNDLPNKFHFTEPHPVGDALPSRLKIDRPRGAVRSPLRVQDRRH